MTPKIKLKGMAMVRPPLSFKLVRSHPVFHSVVGEEWPVFGFGISRVLQKNSRNNQIYVVGVLILHLLDFLHQSSKSFSDTSKEWASTS